MSLSVQTSRQGGFLLPIVMFILIAMGALALVVSRFSGQSALSGAQEGISLQAFYAAESGGQYTLNQIYFVASGGTPVSRAVAVGNCAAADGDVVNFNGAGLANCSAVINCSSNTDVPSATTFFTISSRGRCGSGTESADRTVEISSFIREGV